MKPSGDFELEMRYFEKLRGELEHETIWSVKSGIVGLNHAMFADDVHIVTYECISGGTPDGAIWTTFTAVALDGTIGELWKAAEICFIQAKMAVDDKHCFIEGFEVASNGTLELLMGS